MAHRILIVDDEPNIRSSFASLLKEEGYQTEIAEHGEEALSKIERTRFDLILLDLNLPKLSGLGVLSKLREADHQFTVLVISGQTDIPTALEAIKLGAVDYIEKPVSPEKLITSVRTALMLSSVLRQREQLVSDVDKNSQLVGSTSAMKKLNSLITKTADSDIAVLIRGENGTGKELVATQLYLKSRRRNAPFIRVNCPGIPTTLFESELFGHTKGAFTGAVKDYPGKFVQADGGTLFLDEIGDLPLEGQAKLLRVVETGEVETLGANEPHSVDVRLICATNRNLEELIEKGKFRQDLYYRISGLTVDVPPLRRRLEDVPALIGLFLKLCDATGKRRLSPAAIALLATLGYPGNVRQLKNIIERLCILSRSDIIDLPDIYECGGLNMLPQDDTMTSLSDRLSSYEKQVIHSALSEAGGNIAEAARKLQIDRANLSRKIKQYQITI